VKLTIAARKVVRSGRLKKCFLIYPKDSRAQPHSCRV
jgi:hypothetical protein